MTRPPRRFLLAVALAAISPGAHTGDAAGFTLVDVASESSNWKIAPPGAPKSNTMREEYACLVL